MNKADTFKDLYFLRHGDTGLPGHYIGTTDVPLSETGRNQVKKTGTLLQAVGITKIFCSPLLRCKQTLELVDIPCATQYSDLLREVDFGRWEKKTFGEIVEQDGDLVDAWAKTPERFTFPEGEDLVAFKNRLTIFRSLLEKVTEKNILIIAHGGVIRHLLCLLLGLDSNNYLLFAVNAGCFSSIRLYNEGGVLTGFNLKG